MCRLLAFSFKETTTEEEKNNCISSFRKLADTGRVVHSTNVGHRDGWGLAVYSGENEIPTVYKSVDSAANDTAFDATTFFQEDMKQSGLAHLRKKTVGDTALINTHPFVEGNYSFIHNGTIQKGDGPYEELNLVCSGLTDSERLFRKFLSFLSDNKKTSLDAYLEMLATTKEKYPSFSAINSILHDGQKLYISRIMNQDHPDYVALALEEYYTLYVGKTPSGDIIICSEQLPYEGIEYSLLPNNSVCVIDLATGEQKLRIYSAYQETIGFLGAWSS